MAGLGLLSPRLVVASHVHHPAHLREAVRLRVPAVVVVRRPLDACVSLGIYDRGAFGGELLARWYRFHRAVKALPEVSIVRFENLIGDSDRTLARVISMPHSAWASGPDRFASPRQALVDERIDEMTMSRFGVVDALTVARPTAEREVLKDVERRRIEAEHAALLSECQALYDEVVARSEP